MMTFKVDVNIPIDIESKSAYGININNCIKYIDGVNPAIKHIKVIIPIALNDYKIYSLRYN